MNKKEYLILTTRHRDQLFGGDVHMFWGQNSSGYTAILQRAGLYTKEKAYQIGDNGDIPIHYSVFGLPYEVFESLNSNEIAQLPILYSITKRSKEIIEDWKYELQHSNN